jgi:hypothetical protein
MSDRDRPIWLLDVDGVINATRPGWSAPPRTAWVYADGERWRMRWAPAMLDRLRQLHAGGAVEVRWSTTWCAWADQLERIWNLPALARAFTAPLTGREAADAKLAVARAVLADGRRLIWTDDTEVPRLGPLYDELANGGRGLLIAPAPRYGLQRDHLDAIEAFTAHCAPA